MPPCTQYSTWVYKNQEAYGELKIWRGKEKSGTRISDDKTVKFIFLGTGMTEIMPVPRILILLSYQQRAYGGSFFACIGAQPARISNFSTPCAAAARDISSSSPSTISLVSAEMVTPAQPLVGMVWLMVRIFAPEPAKIDR